MICNGGCIGGAGVLRRLDNKKECVDEYAKESDYKTIKQSIADYEQTERRLLEIGVFYNMTIIIFFENIVCENIHKLKGDCYIISVGKL